MADSMPMTRPRWLILGCGVPVALAVMTLGIWGWVHGAINQLVNLDLVGYSVAFTAPPTAGQAKVTTSQASVTVSDTTGSRIRVRGTLEGSIAKPFFSHEQTSAGLALKASCRASIGDCSLSFDIAVPGQLPADVTDSYGTVQASSLRGTVRLASNSGDVDVSHLTGGIGLADSYGNINASDLSGHVRLSNTSGDINVTGLTLTGGSLIQDSYGNISLRGLSAADVRCANTSGDITIVFTTIPRHVAISDSYGNITLELPPGSTAYQVHTHNSYGNTNISVPRVASSPDVITASNTSGDITITNQ